MLRMLEISLLGVIAAVLLWIAMRPDAPSERSAVQHEFEYVLENGQRISGPDLLRVRQGNDIRIVVRSDQADELHVHGYELTLPVAAGDVGTLAWHCARGSLRNRAAQTTFSTGGA